MTRSRGLISDEVQSWVIRGRTDIGVFAEKGLGIILHPAQIEAGNAITAGHSAYNILTWANRAGKAQPVDEPVLTPTGWRTIGALAVGDRVIAGDGSTTVVTGLYPQGSRPVFRLTFDDGAQTRSCDEHLWKVRPPAARFHRPGSDRGDGYTRVNAGFESWSVLSLHQIRARWGDTPPAGKRCAIPVPGPVMFDEAPVPIDPYALGLLIGDGGLTTGARFSTKDQELVDALHAALPGSSVRMVSGPGCDWSITGLRPALRELGLFGKRSEAKFVPPVYLRNTPEIRLAMLQGLLDTDGSADTGGRVEFSTASPQLADDVVELVRSLGGKSRRVKRQTHYTHKGERRAGRPSYRVCIRLRGVRLFRLARKQSRLSTGAPRHRPERLLVRIEPAGEAESVCIAVAHPDQTYVTNDYIVTHNTTLLIVLHMWAIFYRWGIPVPESDAEEEKWGKEEYRTLHCAPLNELAGRAWLAAGDIISGTSKAQRDLVTGKRRPAPLAQMFATTRERSETGADRLLLRCLNGAVVDFRSTEGKAARVEGGAWRLITWDEWPATENQDDIRFVLYVRLTARAADFDAPIVLTGTITPDTEHIAKEFLALAEDPAVEDWWGNHAARTMNPSTTQKSLGRAERNLDAEDYARMVDGRPGGVKGRVFPSWLIDPAFVTSLPAWQAPDKSEVEGGGPKWTYLHLWDLAIAAADNVGMVLRVPAGWKFSPSNPVVGVSMKIIPGSRTLIDDEIEFAIEETWLPYGGDIYLDTSDAHGKNIYRSMRRRGLPVHPFEFKELDGAKTTRKSRGLKAIRTLFAEGIDKERDAAGEPTHDDLGLVAYDLGKPYGSMKFPLAWTKPKDQLSILRAPPDDERQQKDAAMVVLMGAEICERERRGASRRHRVVRAGYGALRLPGLSTRPRTSRLEG